MPFISFRHFYKHFLITYNTTFIYGKHNISLPYLFNFMFSFTTNNITPTKTKKIITNLKLHLHLKLSFSSNFFSSHFSFTISFLYSFNSFSFNLNISLNFFNYSNISASLALNRTISSSHSFHELIFIVSKYSVSTHSKNLHPRRPVSSNLPQP